MKISAILLCALLAVGCGGLNDDEKAQAVADYQRRIEAQFTLFTDALGIEGRCNKATYRDVKNNFTVVCLANNQRGEIEKLYCTPGECWK